MMPTSLGSRVYAPWLWRSLALTLALACAGGCSKKLEGPAPDVEPPSASAAPPPVDPELICRAQLDTEVTLHGDGFSPVPIDIPHAPKVALPTVTLTRSHELDGESVASPDEVVYSGNPDPATRPTNLELLSWKSRQEMSFLVNQEITLADRTAGMLQEGVWDVTVESPAGDVTESLASLAVVDKPTLEDVAPGIACLAQGARTVDLTGRTFLRNEDAEAELAVEGVAEPFAITRSECTSIAHDGLDAEVCNAGSVELGQGSIEPGFPVLTVQNPETAACASEEDVKLRVVPPPTVDRVEPPLGCVVEEDRSFVVEGADFLFVDGESPTITIGGIDFAPSDRSGCEALDTQGHEVERCSALTFIVAQGALAPDLYEVTVTNPDPAGCNASAVGVLRLVPPPAIEEIEPPVVCVDDSARDVVLTGVDILVVDGVKPAIALDGEPLAASAVVVDDASCEGLDTDRLDVQRCTTLVLTLPEGGVAVGATEVTLTNPDPAGCSDSRSDLLDVVPGPRIDSAEPTLACSEDGMREIALVGEGFLKITDGGDVLLPAVTIDGDAVTSVAIDSADCDAIDVNGLGVERCTRAVVMVAPASLAEDSRPEIVLTNPDPAGCVSTTSEVLTVPPFLEVAAIDPVNICLGKIDTAFPITLTGTGFLRVDGADFVVTAGTAAVSVTDVPAATCASLEVAGFDADTVQSCDAFTGTFDTTGLTTAVGDITVSVSNAVNAPGCPLVASLPLHVVGPPTVTSVDVDPGDLDLDSQLCSGIAFTVLVEGTGFVDGATARFVNGNGMVIEADSVTFLGPTELEATFSDGLPYDVVDPIFDFIVENAGDCVSAPVLAGEVEVNPTPLVFFVDPPVVFNEVAIDVTIFTAGLSASSSADFVELIDSSGDATVLCDEDPGTTSIPDCTTPKFNRIIATVPGIDSGTSMPTFSADAYTVRVTSVLGCFDDLPGGLTVTDTVNDLLLTSVDPSFASPTESTAVTVTGSGFLAVPRLYLTPSSSCVVPTSAKALRAVELSSTAQLNAIVPGEELAPCTYDLLAVNPDDPGTLAIDPEVDVLLSAVTVTVGEPPLVTDVTPDSLTFNTAVNAMTITGEHFDMTSGVDVDIECQPPGGGALEVIATSSISVVSAESITLNASTSGITAGGVCTVTVTNLGEGASFTFSAISIKNSSENLNGWSNVTAMGEGRRALALVAARPTATSRFLYAIGGDDGSTTNAKTSAESIRVDVFGDLVGAWEPQVNSLPAGRTLAGFARIGNFVYLTGGYDGTNTVNTTLRAQVLDPLGGPEIVDLDAVLGDPLAPALGEGLWMYRVSYTYPATDPSNPGGESIAGELLNVELPDQLGGIELVLSWDKNSAADGYLIYRTPVNGTPDDLALLASCPADPGCDCSDPIVCRFTDDATETLGSEVPLPPGSLGVWHEPDVDGDASNGKATLGVERRGLATVAVKHPNATAHTNDWVLYAFGGQDGTDAFRGDYEYAIVTANPGGSQDVSAWQTGSKAMSTIGTGRANLAAWAVRPEDTAFIPAGSVYVFVGMGYTAAASDTAELRSGSLGSTTVGGDLVSADANELDAENGGGSRAAMCYGNSSKFLNMFGGQTGASNLVADRYGEVVAGPDTSNTWSAAGGATLQVERAYCATAQESAFYFSAGGRTGTSNATTSVERTVQ